MKKIKGLLIFILTTVILSSGPIPEQGRYSINNQVFESMQRISINKLLDYEKIVLNIEKGTENTMVSSEKKP